MKLAGALVPLILGRERHGDDHLLAIAIQGNGAHPQQVNERGAVEQLLHPLARDLAAIRAHGISTALPKTSRSISSWNGILTSESGLSQCTTGLTRPWATRRSSSRWSSTVQPLLPRMLNSNDQM